jgi:hypothetical protein
VEFRRKQVNFSLRCGAILKALFLFLFPGGEFLSIVFEKVIAGEIRR